MATIYFVDYLYFFHNDFEVGVYYRNVAILFKGSEAFGFNIESLFFRKSIVYKSHKKFCSATTIPFSICKSVFFLRSPIDLSPLFVPPKEVELKNSLSESALTSMFFV